MNDDPLKLARRHVFAHGPTCGTCIHMTMSMQDWCHERVAHPRFDDGWPQGDFTTIPACSSYRFGLPLSARARDEVLGELEELRSSQT